MKILFIHNNLLGGGAEKVLLTILKELTPPMYDVTLLLIKNKGVYLDAIPKHVKVKYILSKPLLYRFCEIKHEFPEIRYV